MKKLPLLIALLFTLGLGAPFAYAADKASVRAYLILASPEKKGSDARLREHADDLRRLLPGGMESFQVAGEGRAALTFPGRSNVTLGQGHRLEIENERTEGNRVRLNVRWLNGTSVLLDQPSAAARGKAALFAGPRASGESVWAVLLLVE